MKNYYCYLLLVFLFAFSKCNLAKDKFKGVYKYSNDGNEQTYFVINENGENYSMHVYGIFNSQTQEIQRYRCQVVSGLVFTKTNNDLLTAGEGITLQFDNSTNTIKYTGQCNDYVVVDLKKVADIAKDVSQSEEIGIINKFKE